MAGIENRTDCIVCGKTYRSYDLMSGQLKNVCMPCYNKATSSVDWVQLVTDAIERDRLQVSYTMNLEENNNIQYAILKVNLDCFVIQKRTRLLDRYTEWNTLSCEDFLSYEAALKYIKHLINKNNEVTQKDSGL